MSGKRIDTWKQGGDGGKPPLRGFSFKQPERDPMADFVSGAVDCPEMLALRRRLELMGVGHSDRDEEVAGVGCMLTRFESPKGRVTVSHAPGTKGYRSGLLEVCCPSVDSTSRAMTASQVMEWYGASR